MKDIIIGSDHGGFALKEKLKIFLEKRGYKVKDAGCANQESCDYPEFAYAVAKEVSKGEFSRGILICKSGIGNSIAANKVKACARPCAIILRPQGCPACITTPIFWCWVPFL